MYRYVSKETLVKIEQMIRKVSKIEQMFRETLVKIERMFRNVSKDRTNVQKR